MFSVIYKFKVKSGLEESFINSWSALTKLIYQFEGSYGSRLHKESEGHYIAYAMWPDKDTWKNMGAKLPPEAKAFSVQMKEACDHIETSYELEVVSDLLQNKIHSEE